MVSSSKPRTLAVAALLGACAASSQATVLALPADGQWHAFNVSELEARSFGVEWIDTAYTLSPEYGTALEFSFTVAAGSKATLTVVDAGFAGDTFTVTDLGLPIGVTTAVPLQTVMSAPDAGTDFDAALADASFSRGVFELGAGSHRISGSLGQSVGFDGVAINATVGALRLVVSAVPEPSGWRLFAAGLLTLAFVSRRPRG